MGNINRNIFLNTYCYSCISFSQCKKKPVKRGTIIELQIEFENLTNENFISSYAKSYIVIKNKKYFNNIIIFGSDVDNVVDPQFLSQEGLVKNKIQDLKAENLDFILFGTGKKIEQLLPSTIKFVINTNVPFEIMNSCSAYKTYNILLSQGKKVLSFLKLDT